MKTETKRVDKPDGSYLIYERRRKGNKVSKWSLKYSSKAGY